MKIKYYLLKIKSKQYFYYVILGVFHHVSQEVSPESFLSAGLDIPSEREEQFR